MEYQSQGIILESRKLSEADKIVIIYSPQEGRLDLIAKSAYKSSSKFVTSTQVLNYCEFLLAKGRNLQIIKEIKVLKNFSSIQKNYSTTLLAYYCLELNKEHYQKEDAAKQFDFLYKVLFHLDQGLINPLLISLRYLWQFIDLHGYKPELDFCTVSGRKRGAGQIPKYFDFEHGSIISMQALAQSHPYEISPEIFFTLIGLEQQEDFCYEDKILFQSLKLLNKHLEHRLAREFKSWKLLDQEFWAL